MKPASRFKATEAVVMSDYQGSGTKGPHPYLNGDAAGRSVLDIVRAARQLHNTDPSHPVLSAQFATVGHSQGGQAALFAAHLAKTWTPDLQLRGVSVMAPSSFQAGKLKEPPPAPPASPYKIQGLWAAEPAPHRLRRPRRAPPSSTFVRWS